MNIPPCATNSGQMDFARFVAIPIQRLSAPSYWMSLSIQGWTFCQNADFVFIVWRKDTPPKTATTNLRVKYAAEPTQRSSTAVILINESFLPSILSSSSPHIRSRALHVLTSHVIANKRVPSFWWYSICPVELPSIAEIWILAMECNQCVSYQHFWNG